LAMINLPPPFLMYFSKHRASFLLMLKLLSILYSMLIVMSIAEELEAVERERARRRQAHGRTAPGKNASGNISGSDKGETRDKVAAAVGLGSGRTYDIPEVVTFPLRTSLRLALGLTLFGLRKFCLKLRWKCFHHRSRVWKYFHTLKVKAVNPGFVRPLLKGGLIRIRRCARSGQS
jgi:hypothetical protein